MYKPKKNFIIIFFLVFFLILFHYFGFTKFLESSARIVINPISKGVYSLKNELNDYNQFSSDIEKLKQENKRLKEKLAKQQVNKVKLKQTLRENKNLKKSLNFFENNNYENVGVDVIGRSIQQTAQTLILDKGQNSGIEQGDPVIILDGILIGKIAEVKQKTSIVRLLYDNQSKVAATLVGKERSIGLLEGGYGINMNLNYIPQNEKIQIGEKVITSGLSKHIPRGLVIGEVESVKKEPYQPFRTASIKPIIDLDELTYVSVITQVN
ncbi:MAG: rod shape-determining protein MreC [Candidatus Magasanikbacteria bacterium]